VVAVAAVVFGSGGVAIVLVVVVFVVVVVIIVKTEKPKHHVCSARVLANESGHSQRRFVVEVCANGSVCAAIAPAGVFG
jgi:hypothetical protein